MGKGSSPTIGFWYGITMHMGLCNGPVDAILEIRGDDKPMFPGFTVEPVYNDNHIMVTPPGGPQEPPITASGDVYINKPNLYGGEQQEGGVQGTLTVLMGDNDQMPSPALAALETGARSGYRGICSAVFTGLIAAMSPYIKVWAYRVSRYSQGWNTAVWQPSLVKIDRGMNPAHIIYQTLTDPVWSANEDGPQDIDEDSFLDAAQALYDEGLGLCIKWSTADKVGDFIGLVLNHIAALRYIDPVTNKVGLRLLRNDYDPAAMASDPTAILDENDIVEMTSYQPPALDESVNEVVVTYHDVLTHKDASIAYQNLANVQAQGKVVSQSISYLGAWNGDLGARLAARDCHTKSALLIKGECKVKSTRWPDLKLGDVKLLSWAREKCVLMPIRILKINYGDSTARTITVSWAQDEFSVPQSTYVVPTPTQWVEPNHAPQPITSQRVMEIPYRDLARTLDPANLNILASDAGFLAALAERPANAASYNFRLTTSVGGADYADRGPGDFVNGGALASDIVETDTAIMLAAYDDLSRVRIGSAALLGDELVRIDALDPASGAVTIGRGCVDTVPAQHLSGTRLWCYQDHAAADRTEYVDGETVDAKLLTVSSQGTLALSLATTAALTMAHRQARPYPPGNLKINGNRYPTAASGDLVLTWSHRDRLLSADQLIDTLQTDVGPEPGTTYTVRVYVGGVLDSTTTAIAATTLTPVVSAGGVVRVEVDAVRDTLVSWQPLAATFGYTKVTLTLTGDAPNGTPGTAYSFGYTAGGGVPPYTFSIVSGALPSGVTLNASTGVISGTPSAGSASWTIRVTDSVSNHVDLADSATMAYATLALTGDFPDCTVGIAYDEYIAISGGDGTYSLSGGTGVSAGSLPAGLALAVASGTHLRLHGTPTGPASTISFAASVDSGDGQTATSAQSVSVISDGHRYWRIYITAYGGGSNLLIQGGSGFRTVAGGSYISFSPGSNTTASSYATTPASYPPWQAWESITSNAWQTPASPTMPQWNRVDLGAAYHVVEVVLGGPAAAFTDRCATALEIQYSDDDSTWTTAKSFSGLTWGNNELKVLTL